jgi:iron complex transport system permease protein
VTSLDALPADPPAELSGALRYRALARRKLLILFGLAGALALSFAVDLAWGPARYGLDQVMAALFQPGSVSDQVRTVVWDIRMPVAVMAIVTGAALSLAGAQMQTILANPLASPFTLGISAAASFGAALAIVTSVPLLPVAAGLIIPVNAFLMALLATLFIHFISQARGVSVQTVVLLGIALVFTFNALLAFLQYLASEQALQTVVFWTMGSLAKATWPKIGITLAVLLLAIPVFARHAWALTAIRLGEDKAASFGVNVRYIRLESMLVISLLAAVPVSFVGTIGFVGLVGPHIARMILGEDQRFFLPGSILSGALLLSVTSIVSKSIIPGVVFPIGIITALVGVPFFFSLIMSTRRKSW